MTLSLSDIRAAAARVQPYIHRTPVMTSATFDAAAGASLFFKCENFQKIGAFKARGATNAVFSLTQEEVARGVTTHSSGNHAAALARAARLRGMPAYIVMPNNAPAAKVASVQRQQAELIRCEPTLAAREAAAAAVMARTGATLIHPYNDLRVIAGQGTATLELLEEVPDLDLILTPVGGGGLLSGTAVAAKGLNGSIRVIGVEPALADDAARSFRTGSIEPMSPSSTETIADGLRTHIGEHSFALIQSHVDDIVTVSETGIVAAMRAIWETMKIIVEPSAAVPFAAIREGTIDVANRRIGIIVSGGNLDLERLPWQK